MKFRKCCGRRANLPHASTCPIQVVPTDRAGVFEIAQEMPLDDRPAFVDAGSGSRVWHIEREPQSKLVREVPGIMSVFKVTKRFEKSTPK